VIGGCLRRVVRLVWGLGLGLAWLLGAAQAHDVPPSTLMLDWGQSSIQVDMEVPLSELVAALGQPLPDEPTLWLQAQQMDLQRYFESHWGMQAPDGRPYALQLRSMQLKPHDNPRWRSQLGLLMRWRATPPERAATDAFSLDYTAIIERVLNHEALVYMRRDLRHGLLGEQAVLIGSAGFGSTHVRVEAEPGNWWSAGRLLFMRGMHHIAEGTDHLLFLLALLLCAPLQARDGRWVAGKPVHATVRSVVGIISGFTLGHSLSLALAATGWLSLPTAWVESMVAVSILVSCSQAWRPWWGPHAPGLAIVFGWVHGFAFAEALSGLDFDGTTLAVSLLGFNLGIEAMQLAVMALTLPLLLAASESRHAQAIRLALASAAAACALAWLLERALGWRNPLQGLLACLAPPPAWLAWGLGLASLGLVGQRLRGLRRAAVQSKPG